MLACPSVGCERPFVSARSENAPGGIRTRDQRLSQSSDRTRKAVMLNRATPPERGVPGLNRPFRRVSTDPEIMEQGVDFFLEDAEPLSEKFLNFYLK